jgi:hypothetical protein
MDQEKLDANLQPQEADQAGQTRKNQKKDKKEKTPEQEAGRMRNIQAIVTTLVLILVAFLVITNWNDEEGYIIQIPTDDGYNWEYSIEGDSQNLLQVNSAALEDGKYTCRIDGIDQGEGEIVVRRFAEEDPDAILEQRIYHVTVTEDGTVIQKSVERTFYN